MFLLNLLDLFQCLSECPDAELGAVVGLLSWVICPAWSSDLLVVFPVVGFIFIVAILRVPCWRRWWCHEVEFVV